MKNLKTKVLLSFMLVFVLIFQSLPVNAKSIKNSKNQKIKYVTKAKLPFTCFTSNDMSITINSFSASTTEVVMNITITNDSSYLDKGNSMTTPFTLYDGRNTLKEIEQDQQFYDNSFSMFHGQSVTGNITFEGIKNKTKTFSLNGMLSQFSNTKFFKINFKNDKVIDGANTNNTIKDMIGKSDLPYTYSTPNNMAIKFNDYSISSTGIVINVTITNTSSTLNTGDPMISTYKIYDGKSMLKYLAEDRSLTNGYSDLFAGQSVTGNIYFEGITTQNPQYVTLIGTLWQHITSGDFQIKLKNE